jgi:endonuclease/exonuclease/phosphatase family metal-dependent hydrolase
MKADYVMIPVDDEGEADDARKHSMQSKGGTGIQQSGYSGLGDAHEAAAASRKEKNPTQQQQQQQQVRVLTFNSWVGDYRRGYYSRDTERQGWVKEQLRLVDADVICLQEVLEADTQLWFQETFSDYEFVVLHQSHSTFSSCLWLVPTLGPGLVLAWFLWFFLGLWGSLSAGLGFACFMVLDRLFTHHAEGYPAFARFFTMAGFPVFGAKMYLNSTNASLAIGVRKSFGTLSDPAEEWFENQGEWWHYTVAGLERELRLFNPDRWLNCTRNRGVLSATVHPHSRKQKLKASSSSSSSSANRHHRSRDDTGGDSSGGGIDIADNDDGNNVDDDNNDGGGGGAVAFRVVNMHLNIGVTNPEVRVPQVHQLLRTAVAPYAAVLPVVLCGDTNGCANVPEPEMDWLINQKEVALVDCWEAAGDGGPGWTWDRANPLTHSGPLLEPDQRTDVIFVSANNQATTAATSSVPAALVPLECSVVVYPPEKAMSDHYGVVATLGFAKKGHKAV